RLTPQDKYTCNTCHRRASQHRLSAVSTQRLVCPPLRPPKRSASDAPPRSARTSYAPVGNSGVQEDSRQQGHLRRVRERASRSLPGVLQSHERRRFRRLTNLHSEGGTQRRIDRGQAEWPSCLWRHRHLGGETPRVL